MHFNIDKCNAYMRPFVDANIYEYLKHNKHLAPERVLGFILICKGNKERLANNHDSLKQLVEAIYSGYVVNHGELDEDIPDSGC